MIVALVLGGLLEVLAIAGIAHALLAGHFLGRLDRRARVSIASPPVTLLKPLCGAEPGLHANLESFLVQHYAGEVQMVLGVQDPDDPALAVVESLRRAYPKADIEVVVDPRPHGANRKVSNLINMLGRARYEVLVLSDADIAVAPDYLSQVAGALDAPGVGVVTLAYRGEGRAGLWSVLAAMGVSYGFLTNVALGTGLDMAHPCMGSTIAIRRSTLDRIGGFERVKDELIDDYEIGRAVRELGLQVALGPAVVTHGCSEAGAGALFSHELRWAATVRMVDPAGHAGSVVGHPVALALFAAVLLQGRAFPLAVLLATIATRFWLKGRVDRIVGANSGPAVLLPLRDLLSFAVFAASLFARTVYWRGRSFGVSSARKSLQPGS
jgi:ceramide glucosyltransferase